MEYLNNFPLITSKTRIIGQSPQTPQELNQEFNQKKTKNRIQSKGIILLE